MSMSTRRDTEVGKADLEIEIGTPQLVTKASQEPTPEKATPDPEPDFDKKLAEQYPWLVDGKPKDSKILRAVWRIYAGTWMKDWEWVPVPREVPSYPKAVAELRDAINKLTDEFNASGVISITSYKGGVGKTNDAALLTFAASIASKESCMLIDTDLDGATALSRVPLNEGRFNNGMSTPEFVAIYEAAMEEMKPAEDELTTDEEILAYVDSVESGEWYRKVNPPTLTELQTLPRRPYKDPVSGAIIIAEDPTPDPTSEIDETTKPKVRLSADQFEHAIRFGRRLAYLVVADTPPGFDKDASIGVNRQVSIQLRTGRYDQPISLQRVASMRRAGEVDMEKTLEPQGKGSKVETKVKVKFKSRPNSPLILVGAVPSRLCNRRTQYRLAQQLSTVPDHVLLIPFINDLDTAPVEIEKLDARTQYFVFKAVLRTLLKLKEFNEAAAKKAAVTTPST